MLRRIQRFLVKRGTFAVPIGEAGRICSANKKFSQIFLIFAALRLMAEYEKQS
jgi:hypothetical protein